MENAFMILVIRSDHYENNCAICFNLKKNVRDIALEYCQQKIKCIQLHLKITLSLRSY